MNANSRILTALKWSCGTANIIGLGIMLISILASDYNKDYILTVMGLTILAIATLIFLIGVLFIAAEEMVMNTEKGERVIPLNTNVIHFNKAAYIKRKRRVSN